MNIVIEYDSSVNSAPAGFKTAVQAAVNFYDHLITSSITVPIMFSYNELDGQNLSAGALGESSTNGNIETYSKVVSLLSAAAHSHSSLVSLTTLPGADPTGGGRFWVSDAQAAAFGLGSQPGYTDPEDGFVALGSANFTFDPANRAVTGAYDAIGVLEHEISEVLGRTSNLGTSTFEGYALYSPMDLFRYSAAGTHELTSTAGYFSVDGQNMLAAYNDPSNGGDAGDWSSSVANDAFDAFSSSGIANTISYADKQELNLLGFNINWGVSHDFANAGQSDALWRAGNGDTVLWLANAASASFSFTTVDLGMVPNNWTIQKTGDFTGFGKTDILWRETGGDVYLWLSSPGPGFTGFSHTDLGVVPISWTIAGVGDFNGDGKADVLWREAGGGAYLWMANSGSGFTGFQGVNLGVVPTDWTIQQVGDFTGDGKASVLWRETGGDTYLWTAKPGAGTIGFADNDLGVVSTSMAIAGIGDFNGDGKADILWSNTAGDIQLWLSNSGSGFHGFSHQDLGVVAANMTVLQVGDYNGDGKADMLLRAASGDVQLWESNTGSGYTGFTHLDLGVHPTDWHLF